MVPQRLMATHLNPDTTRLPLKVHTKATILRILVLEAASATIPIRELFLRLPSCLLQDLQMPKQPLLEPRKISSLQESDTPTTLKNLAMTTIVTIDTTSSLTVTTMIAVTLDALIAGTAAETQDGETTIRVTAVLDVDTVEVVAGLPAAILTPARALSSLAHHHSLPSENVQYL